MAKSAQEIVDLLVGFKNSSTTGSRDDVLKDALQTLETLWSSNQQADFEEIAQKIADAGRDGEFRPPFPYSPHQSFGFWRSEQLEESCFVHIIVTQRLSVGEIDANLHFYVHLDKWRIPIGESGVLDFFLDKVQDQGSSNPVVQTLRVIGNACVDCGKSHLILTICPTLYRVLSLTDGDLVCLASLQDLAMT